MNPHTPSFSDTVSVEAHGSLSVSSPSSHIGQQVCLFLSAVSIASLCQDQPSLSLCKDFTKINFLNSMRLRTIYEYVESRRRQVSP